MSTMAVNIRLNFGIRQDNSRKDAKGAKQKQMSEVRDQKGTINRRLTQIFAE